MAGGEYVIGMQALNGLSVYECSLSVSPMCLDYTVSLDSSLRKECKALGTTVVHID